MIFYIFRHGETFATKANSGYGYKIFTAPILVEGKPVLYKMAEYLKKSEIDYFVTSPLRRCKQTSEIVKEVIGVNYKTDFRLREYFLEPIGRFKNRISHFITNAERLPHSHIAICTHGAVITALIKLLLGNSLTFKDMGYYPRPGVLTIIENGKLSQIDFN